MSTPVSILFVCDDNSIFSPLAAAMVRQNLEGKIKTDSCGLITDELNPFAFGIAEEVGLSLIPYFPKTLTQVDVRPYSLCVAFSAQAAAQARAQYLDAGLNPVIEFWPLPNPSAVQGSRKEVLAAFRACRDALKQRIQARFPDLWPKY
jgi:protein-tyrosine-phosphatase